MELLLGSHVREHGNRVGRLAAFELEPVTLRIRRIIYSPDGDLSPAAQSRAVTDVSHVHDDGEIELRPYADDTPMPPVRDVVQLSRSTAVRNGGRQTGRLAGVEVEVSERLLLAVIVRTHWWSRRTVLPARSLDFSTPGEIRQGPGGTTRAA